LDHLETTGWGIKITGIRSDPKSQTGDPAPVFEYALDVGASRLLGCVFEMGDSRSDLGARDSEMGQVVSIEGGPEGACLGFSYQPQYQADTQSRLVRTPLKVELDGAHSHAISTGETRLTLGTGQDVEAEGTVRIDLQDTYLSDGRVFVPDPQRPEPEEVPIKDFSLLQTQELQSTRDYRWDFDITYPTSEAVASWFGGAEELTLVHLQAALRIDLNVEPAGYVLEGRAITLNRPLGHVSLHYYPGRYASFYLPSLEMPAPLGRACFAIEDALIEVDLEEKRFRAHGGMLLRSDRSFSCRVLDIGEMSSWTRLVLDQTLKAAQRRLRLPEQVSVRSHLVLDTDDRIFCGDLMAQGRSLIKLAYLGREQRLLMQAPKRFVTTELSPESLLTGAVRLGKDFAWADWSFPASGWKCWKGDTGPRTTMGSAILEP